MPSQRRLDVTQLDPEAPNLDLMIDPAQAFDRAVRQSAGQVAGLVEPSAGHVDERIGNKLLCSQPRPLMVTPSQAVAADVQLPQVADRHGLKPFVEDMGLCIGDRPANRDAVLLRRDRLRRGPDGRLSRTIHVPKGGGATEQRPRQLQRQGLAPAKNLHTWRPRPISVQQQPPGCRGRLKDGSAALCQDFLQSPPVRGGLPADNHHAGAHDQGQE